MTDQFSWSHWVRHIQVHLYNIMQHFLGQCQYCFLPLSKIIANITAYSQHDSDQMLLRLPRKTWLYAKNSWLSQAAYGKWNEQHTQANRPTDRQTDRQTHIKREVHATYTSMLWPTTFLKHTFFFQLYNRILLKCSLFKSLIFCTRIFPKLFQGEMLFRTKPTVIP